MKHVKKKYIIIVLAVIAFIWITYQVLNFIFPVDLSQEYRKITGIEDVVFHAGWGNKFYRRCFWGLTEIKEPENLKESQEIEVPVELLEKRINTDFWISQTMMSRDGNYILYCETDHHHMGHDMPDDDYCYYRIYDINSGESVTIYEGYRQWYNLYW